MTWASILTLTLAWIRPAAAEPPASTPPAAPTAPANPPGADKSARRGKIMERVRVLRAWKLTDALELDEPTAAKLFPILNRYDTEFAKVMRETRALRQRVRSLTGAGAGADRAEFERVLDLLVANQRKLWDLQEARFDEVRKVLTPAQAATILVVLPEIDRRIHRQVRRALRRGRDGGQDARPKDDGPANKRSPRP